MKDKNTVRAYMLRDTDSMVGKFASKNDMTKQEAYNTLVLNCLDSEGNLRDRIVLTQKQFEGVDEISKSLNQTTLKTVHDLIDSSMLLLGTDLTLRDVLVYSLPLLRERFKDINPELAREMLKK